MKASIVHGGKQLPENFEELQQLASEGKLARRSCFTCGKPFTPDNVRTAPGWRETQISGACETCFDQMFAED